MQKSLDKMFLRKKINHKNKAKIWKFFKMNYVREKSRLVKRAFLFAKKAPIFLFVFLDNKHL